MKIDIYHHRSDEQRLVRIEGLLLQLNHKAQIMGNAIDDLDQKVTRLQGITANIGEQLYELKSALDTAVLNNNMTAIAAISAKVGTMIDALKTAGEATDITPDTPVEDPPVEDPPVEDPPVEPPVEDSPA